MNSKADYEVKVSTSCRTCESSPGGADWSRQANLQSPETKQGQSRRQGVSCANHLRALIITIIILLLLIIIIVIIIIIIHCHSTDDSHIHGSKWVNAWAIQPMRLYPERTPSLLHGIHVKFEKRTIKVDIAAVRFSHLPLSCPIKALPSLERRGRSTPLLVTTLDATSAQRQDPHAKLTQLSSPVAPQESCRPCA